MSKTQPKLILILDLIDWWSSSPSEMFRLKLKLKLKLKRDKHGFPAIHGLSIYHGISLIYQIFEETVVPSYRTPPIKGHPSHQAKLHKY